MFRIAFLKIIKHACKTTDHIVLIHRILIIVLFLITQTIVKLLIKLHAVMLDGLKEKILTLYVTQSTENLAY